MTPHRYPYRFVRTEAPIGDDGAVERMRGWPVTLTEGPVGLRPLRLTRRRAWRDARVRNADWLRPWEPTNPETPLYRTSLGPYVAMARTMRREARQGLALPWVVTYGGGSPGSSPSAASCGARPGPPRSATGSTRRSPAGGSFPPRWPWPWTTASSSSACTASRPPSAPRITPAAASWKSSASAKKASAGAAAHRRRLAGPHLLRAHGRGRARGPARPVAASP